MSVIPIFADYPYVLECDIVRYSSSKLCLNFVFITPIQKQVINIVLVITDHLVRAWGNRSTNQPILVRVKSQQWLPLFHWA